MSPYAFPFTPTDRSGQCAETQPGMTIRDYFAGQALAGLLATWTPEQSNFPNPDDVAFQAYEIADSMECVRRKTSEQ